MSAHISHLILHTLHCARILNTVVITTVIEMVEILDGRVGKCSVERVRYVINNLLHLVIVKYGVISLVLCISTSLRFVTILSLLVKYLVLFHADLQLELEASYPPVRGVENLCGSFSFTFNYIFEGCFI